MALEIQGINAELKQIDQAQALASGKAGTPSLAHASSGLDARPIGRAGKVALK
jgi:hypothetical protein